MFIVGLECGVYVLLFIGSLYVNKKCAFASEILLFSRFRYQTCCLANRHRWHCLQHFIREATPSALPLDDETTEFCSMKHLEKCGARVG
jgi:hypothetical protein